MQDPAVVAMVEEERAARAPRLRISEERIVEAYAAIAFGDVRSVVSYDDGKVKITPSVDLTEDEVMLIASIETHTRTDRDGNVTVTTRIKLQDRQRALEALARIKGMFRDRIEVEHGSAADYTVGDFRPPELGLYAKGSQAPKQQREKVSQRLSLNLRARDRHRMAKTGFSQLSEAWLREAANFPTGRVEPGPANPDAPASGCSWDSTNRRGSMMSGSGSLCGPVQSTSDPVSRLYSLRRSRLSTQRSERSFT
jgi:hypothetical protein